MNFYRLSAVSHKDRHTHTSSILTLFAVQFSVFLMFWFLYDSHHPSKLGTRHVVQYGTPRHNEWVGGFSLYLSTQNDSHISFCLVSSILVFCFTTIHFITILWPFYVRYTISFKYQDERYHPDRERESKREAENQVNSVKRFLNDACQINCL